MKHTFSALLSAAALLAAGLALAAAPAAPAASGAKGGASETLPTGIVVKHTKTGTGASPKASDTVQVHYRGKLVNGTEFDSSYKRNQPASFPLNGVIACWTEGLQRMKVGGSAQLTCPPATAYGSRGAGGGLVPPNATLVFDVELLAIGAK
ncbi:FKBP-type peptidyl-prolyl cis-trans isomerase [Ramlibacter sp.]|uniref:FKBP-type peptidyl-prolyl cis-trans isomerase n=1 Tax=Ramlibacter sp. TaxID=1917967 RepID=UPI002CA8A350|nr:FKBP-type peptidyl-prolyl cis-trans isomerase [Ramlibacter sp.]HWI81333.1 FKBP-type peptidyl-prolyl cis-trans isomerase [Ramlibacter sp.]